MPIPQHVIDEVRDRSDIVEIVGQYVDLKRAGANYKALCPFHQERTPSFTVSPEKQIFHCFGCGKGGNVYQFVMEMDGVSFPEAVRTLGRRAGIDVETRPSDEDRSKNDALYRANSLAARFYHDGLLKSRFGEKARRYLDGRAIPEEAWARFGLGYAPASGEALWEAMRAQGVSRDVLVQLRLVSPRDAGGHYDYFRDRVIFPIVLPGDRVAAFGGRAMGDADPKYLNSAESPIFQKRRTYYGLDHAREPIRSRRGAVIVEGYTDLIRLHLVGVENSIATCGTSLTREHAVGIRRLTRSAILVPDGDLAGENAALASGALLLAEGMEVGVVPLAEGTDPDSAARSMSPSEFADLLGRPLEYFAYLDYTIRRRQPSLREREDLIKRIVGGIAQSVDPLRGDLLVGELARVVGVDPAGLRRLLRPVASKPDPGGRETTEPSAERSGGTRGSLERLVLRLVLEGTPGALEALESIDAEDFCNEANRKFYKVLDEARGAHIDLRSRDFQRRAEETGLGGLATEIALVSVPPGNVETLLKDAVRRLKKLRIRDELAVLRERLVHLPSDSEEAVAVAEYYQRLRQALNEL